MKFSDVYKIRDLPSLEKKLKLKGVLVNQSNTRYKLLGNCTEEELNETFTFYDYFNHRIYETCLEKNKTLNALVPTDSKTVDLPVLVKALTEKEDFLKLFSNLEFALNIENELEEDKNDSFKIIFHYEHQNTYSVYFDYWEVPELLEAILRNLKDKEVTEYIKDVNVENILMKTFESDNLDIEDIFSTIASEAQLIMFNEKVSASFIKVWSNTVFNVIDSVIDINDPDENKKHLKYAEVLIKIVKSLDYIYNQDIKLLKQIEDLDIIIKKSKEYCENKDFLTFNELIIQLQDFSTLKNLDNDKKCKWMKKEVIQNDTLIELPYPAFVLRSDYVVKSQKRFSKNTGKVITALDDMYGHIGEYFKDNINVFEVSHNEKIMILSKPFVDDTKEQHIKKFKKFIQIIFEERDIIKMTDKLNKDKEKFYPSLEEALQESLIENSPKSTKKPLVKF